MTAGKLLLVLWRQRLIAAVLILLTLASTSVYLSRAERVYTATGTVGVYPQPDQVESFPSLIGPLLGTLVDVVRSNENLEDARSRVPGAPPVYELRGAVTAQAVTDTFVLRVSVDSTDPTLAAALVNAVTGALPRRGLFEEQIQFTTLESAGVPSTPTSPQTRLIYGLGLVLAFALATAGALISESRRRRVDRVEDVSEALGVPVLAELDPPQQLGLGLGVDDVDTGEGMRSLRIALHAAGTRGALVVASTSQPSSQEQRESWVAPALAVALARIGWRVLLVQARSDVDHERLLLGSRVPVGKGGQGTAPEAEGLSELLRGAPAAGVLRDGPVDGLTLLSAGARAEDLPELLETDFGRVMATLRPDFALIVVDAPPTTVSDDARVMAREATVLLTLELGRADDRDLREAASGLAVVGASIVGAAVVRGQAAGLLRRITGR